MNARRLASPVVTLVLGLALAAAAAACGSDDGPDGVAFLWDPGAGELAAFPDDAFTVDDAASRTGLRPSMDPEQFPILAEVPDTYRQIFSDMSKLDGFGITAGMMFRFDGALDPASLWSGVETADPAAPIVLVVETADGPTPWPYEARLTDEGATVILEPMAPLPPATRCYVALTTRLATVDGRAVIPSTAMRKALAKESVDDNSARVAPRIAAAAEQLVNEVGAAASTDELAGVVVFTTQSVYEDAIVIAADIASRTVEADPAIACVTEATWVRCDGTFTAVDYRGADGFIEDIGPGGAPDTSTTYSLPFVAWLPLDAPADAPYGGDAYPAMIFGHGLGSGRNQGDRLAEFAAPRGIATVAIDALRHGDHPTATARSTLVRTMDFFGISTDDLSFLPLVMREQFRQSTYDKLQLLRMIELGLDLDGDGAADLDADRVQYFGVSLGGIMGPELVALAPRIKTAILAVPGGRVSSIVSDADQFGIVIDLMRPPDATDGDVDRFFPILQTMLDRGDAAAWATHLLTAPADRPAGFPASAPHILMGMVLDDDTVPNTANRALARAMGIPVVPPLRQEVGLVGVTAEAPVSGNLLDGRTAGLLQFDLVPDDAGGMKPATHSNVSDSEVGIEAWFRFMDGFLGDGTPVIVDPYAELGL